MNHLIKIEQGIILCDKMRVGFVVRDPDGIFVNVTGVVCMRFKNYHRAMRWIKRNLESMLADLRSWQIEHIKPYPKSRFSIAS